MAKNPSREKGKQKNQNPLQIETPTARARKTLSEEAGLLELHTERDARFGHILFCGAKGLNHVLIHFCSLCRELAGAQTHNHQSKNDDDDDDDDIIEDPASPKSSSSSFRFFPRPCATRYGAMKARGYNRRSGSSVVAVSASSSSFANGDTRTFLYTNATQKNRRGGKKTQRGKNANRDGWNRLL